MLNAVLNALFAFTFVEDTFETLKNRIDTNRRDFREDLSCFDHELASQFDFIFIGIFEKHEEELQSDEIVEHSLVNEMCEHFYRRFTDQLVVSLVGTLELENHSSDDQIDDVWHLRVDHRNQPRVNMREVRRGLIKYIFIKHFNRWIGFMLVVHFSLEQTNGFK